MARYIVKFGHTDAERDDSAREFHTRPAAYRFAYARLYEFLGNVAGRDTEWGRRQAAELDGWLVHRDRLAAVCQHPFGYWSLFIVTPDA